MSGYPLNNTNYNWERRPKKYKNGSEGGGGDTGDITLGQAWMKTFNEFKTPTCPVSPVKVLKNFDVLYSDIPAPAVNFIENYSGYCYEPSEDAILYNIEDLPDSIYEESEENLWFFLYKLDDLNRELSDGSVHIYTSARIGNIAIDFITNQYSLNKFNTHIILVNDEYYVVYNDNLD